MENGKNIDLTIGTIVYLFNDGKHIVHSFTKTSIRFICDRSKKIQTINQNTFYKNHNIARGYWSKANKVQQVNMEYK